MENPPESRPPSPQPERKPLHFKQWLSVLYHTHSKFAALSYDVGLPHVQQTLQHWQDGQFTTSALVETTAQLGERKGGFLVVDTEHAAHSLPVYHPLLFPDKRPEEVRAMRTAAFKPDTLPQTIATLSKNLELRRSAIDKLRTTRPEFKDRIFTGVEVDILNREGMLDIANDTLLRCDVVGASIHKDEWHEVTEGKQGTLADINAAYLQIARNPVVDILNHFIREIPAPLQQEIEKNPACFDELFTTLATEGKCLEINMRDMVDPKREGQNKLMLQLAQRAKERGVKFVLGVDFHRIEQYLPDTLPGGLPQKPIRTDDRKKLEALANGDTFFTSREEAEKFESEVRGTLQEMFPKYTTRLARPLYRALRRLDQTGITPEDVVNGNEESFKTWVKARRQKKDAVIAAA